MMPLLSVQKKSASINRAGKNSAKKSPQARVKGVRAAESAGRKRSNEAIA
jgi:hypothetical protein